MTIAPITLAVIGAVLIIALLALASWARVKADLARSNGYDQGYSDSQFAASEYRSDLEKQLAASISRLATANHQREAIIRDADERIAIFAGRSYISNDLAAIKRAAKQLKATAITFSELKNNAFADQAQFAMEVGLQLDTLAKRIQQQLDAPAAITAVYAAHAEAEDTLLAIAADAANHINGKSWFVRGPQGCGKTTNAQAIANALGLTEIVDDWQPGMKVPTTKALVLTNDDSPLDPAIYRRVLTFQQAMALVASKAKPEVTA